MGVFKKTTVPVSHDEDIRREIRARVAKQVGIYDEEYIKTGKISGKKPSESSETSTEAAPVSVATEKIQQPTPKEPDNNEKTSTAIPLGKGTAPSATEKVPAKEKQPSAKEKTPAKEKQPSAKEKTPTKEKQPSNGKKSQKKKKSTVPLIIFILLLILAFIPFYYYFTGVDSQEPDTVLLQEK